MGITVQYARELDNRCRAFQCAQDRYAALSAYMAEMTAEKLRATRAQVSWDWGSATSGYKEMAEVVSRRVAKDLFDLMQHELREAQQERDQRLAELKAWVVDHG